MTKHTPVAQGKNKETPVFKLIKTISIKAKHNSIPKLLNKRKKEEENKITASAQLLRNTNKVRLAHEAKLKIRKFTLKNFPSNSFTV